MRMHTSRDNETYMIAVPKTSEQTWNAAKALQGQNGTTSKKI